MTDRELCEKYGRPNNYGWLRVPLTGFAEACFNDLSESDLREVLQGPAIPADCEDWGITEGEWRSGVEAALAAKILARHDDTLPPEVEGTKYPGV